MVRATVLDFLHRRRSKCRLESLRVMMILHTAKHFVPSAGYNYLYEVKRHCLEVPSSSASLHRPFHSQIQLEAMFSASIKHTMPFNDRARRAR